MPKIDNNPKVFGDQVIIDENEKILYYEERLLLVSSTLGVSELVKLVLKHSCNVFCQYKVEK